MLKALLLGAALLLTAPLAYCQATFSALNRQAMGAYSAKNYAESGKLFDQAFKDKAGKPTSTDYYNAACSWALAGDKDKAFRYLDRATGAGWDNVAHVKQDTDLTSLRTDKRWPVMLAKLDATVAKAEAKLNQPLKKELQEIYATDQGVRGKIDSVQRNFGQKSPQWDALMSEMRAIDERNTKRVTEIIDQYGWPGKALVGRMGSLTAFLVIQHADLAVQEKYFDVLKQAAARGDIAPGNFALLQDRVLLRRGKSQIYGSQVVGNPSTGKPEFAPIEDEAHVDERRAAVGLGPLAEYAKNFGFEYTPKK
ncbi:DUF6624 domain-containing protein [Hymenobacter sp. CRA2]|uniref:DUF6624 domain-containing protein n=1 Tax=Hymenobacter sp. CRA2 TaxID=1955620 RepID=UPI0009901697|nr:DUF6624 domain-containing protein [Hymenobacter sp. CRA2]OON65590.1 hypothetical protein B0919_23875 [Hymenobacter sp. CRA2]